MIAMLRERTSCALGDDEARQLQPSVQSLTIREGMRETSDARKILAEEGSIPLGGIHDIREQISKAEVGSILQPTELMDVAETLSSGRRLRAFIIKRSERCPKLTELAVNIGQFQRIEETVHDCIAENGTIRDTASPELARVRSKLKTTHSRMMDKLHSIIQSSEYRTYIQDPIITQRGDRYCIPVKAEHRPNFPGIVHDSSASGATVFVEPASVIDMGNDLRELATREIQEMEKVLMRLTVSVKASASEIRVTLTALGRIDFASAKARLSADMYASEPVLNHEGKIRLIRARHPLLKGDVVPIDVELGRRFRTLLITGPNTGGKTVTLKTIGLLTLMAQSGLHIPADDGSELAIFDTIFADIGDEQSIQQSLSTFSSHLTNIVNIIRNLGRQSLVLMDEIGAGTDPAEGAALAKAILDYLNSQGALTVATTHYGELKEFAFVRDGVENASVEFDVQTLRPTYRLMIGVPGSSNAFAIASRLGLPDEIVASAGQMIKGGEASDVMIRRIEESHRSAAEREQSAERVSRDVEILRRRYEERIEEVDALRRDMRRQLTEEVNRRVGEKIHEMEAIIQDLKREGAQPKKLQQNRERFKESIRDLEEEVENMLPTAVEEVEEAPVLKAGDRVRVMSFGIEGDLLNGPGSGDAIVLAGTMKLTVPFTDLRAIRRPKDKSRSAAKEPSMENVRIASTKAVGVSSELKLIAQRVEEALENLDKYLDDAYLAGLPSVRIIHGKGTGALRKAVWEFLAKHHSVLSYRMAGLKEGGAGATIVEFKDR